MRKSIKYIINAINLHNIFKLLYGAVIKFFKDLHYYGIKIAYYNFWGLFANARLLGNKFNKIIKNKRDSFIYKYLEFKYKDFIYAYKNKDIEIGNNTKKIWCCRWQGEETAPKIVKICINSIRKHKNGYEVIVIDKNNYSKYIDLPDYIIEKNKKGIISITHLSDIIRFGLLSKYGGIWIDSTIFINSNIVKQFDNINFNSYYPYQTIKNDFGFTKWSGFFIGGSANRLFSFVFDFYLRYWYDYSEIINYFLMDYIILLAYNNFSDVKNDIDNLTIKDDNILMDFIGISKWFNEEYIQEKYDKVMNNGFLKLSYKTRFIEKTRGGKLTNYGYFMETNKFLLN